MFILTETCVYARELFFISTTPFGKADVNRLKNTRKSSFCIPESPEISQNAEEKHYFVSRTI